VGCAEIMNALHPHSFGVVLLSIALLLSRTTCEAQVVLPGTLVLTEADNGTTANAVIGQAIAVHLRGNLSTGYAWALANSNGISVLTNGPTTYTVDPGGGVGVGGTFSFPFLAVTPGDTALTFEYRPPGGGPPAQTFTVTIHVMTAPPRLSIELAKTNVVISWPIAGSTNFFLEGATSLSPWQWAALNVLPLPQGTNYTVTLGTSDSPLYFRLHHL
jgi:predicted secreted protein